uniref:hypothetical protein n=1 Tax=Cronobacter malonaticus TaxID=413503 RepID=UPI001F3D031A
MATESENRFPYAITRALALHPHRQPITGVRDDQRESQSGRTGLLARALGFATLTGSLNKKNSDHGHRKRKQIPLRH